MKSDRKEFIFNSFIYFKPVKKFEYRESMRDFRSFDTSTCKRVLKKSSSHWMSLSSLSQHHVFFFYRPMPGRDVCGQST